RALPCRSSLTSGSVIEPGTKVKVCLTPPVAEPRERVTFTKMQTTRTTRPGTALAVLCTAQFVDVMGVTVVVVALPTMRGALQASPAQVQLVVSAYAFLFGCLLLAGGRAADRWGRLRLFRG